MGVFKVINGSKCAARHRQSPLREIFKIFRKDLHGFIIPCRYMEPFQMTNNRVESYNLKMRKFVGAAQPEINKAVNAL
jgi:hypothetical protein